MKKLNKNVAWVLASIYYLFGGGIIMFFFCMAISDNVESVSIGVGFFVLMTFLYHKSPVANKIIRNWGAVALLVTNKADSLYKTPSEGEGK